MYGALDLEKFCENPLVLAKYSSVLDMTSSLLCKPTKTCRWKYYDKNTSVELSAFCWFLIHIIQIHVQNMEHIKISCFICLSHIWLTMKSVT